MAKQAVSLVLLALCAASLAARLPGSWPTCQYKDPNFNKCLSSSIEKVVYLLKDGDKQLGLNPIGPLKVDEMTLDLGSGPFSLLLNAKDISFQGLEKTTFKEASVDMDKHEIKLKAFTPNMRLDFMYQASGKILVIAVKGDGPANIELDAPTTDVVIKGEPFQKKGKTYWNITDFKIDIAPTHMKSHFHELLKGNAAVSEQVNGFLNSDWKLFFQQIKGPAEEAFGQIFKSMAQRVFSRVPINDIFLD
ncbi:protein takeout-like [Thrips palmi]|uniref:Protein takeout-like n=1 Tax=Thrips palmi TaxID=161013 RepID=A0A6P8Y5R4_THRPL|nr:protein takeout-like [Thrips palmi]